MPFDALHVLPVAVFICLPGTFIITYIIAISRGDVEVEVPYISDDATHVPEANIFAQMLNMVSMLIGVTIYVRYKQVEQYYRDHLSVESSRILRHNLIALYIGWASAFFLSMVANFRENELLSVHLIGAFGTFACGLIYAWIHTILSYKMYPLVNTLRTARIRCFLCMIMTVTYIITAVLGPMAHTRFHGKDRTHWKPDDGGYVIHTIASSCEWVTAMCLNFFILTFAREFHRISLTSPKIVFITEISGGFPNYPGDTSSIGGSIDEHNEQILIRNEAPPLDHSFRGPSSIIN